MSLNVVVYSPCWNEAVLLPFFLRHYGRFARTINLLDNGSTDRSHDIIGEFRRRRPDVTVNVRPLDSAGQTREDYIINFKNHAWKECAGQPVDWVVIADVDEFAYHENLPAELRRLRRHGYTALMGVGYEMIAQHPPRPNDPAELTSLIKRGRFSADYSKCIAFDPNQITAINYHPGAHVCTPGGNVRIHHDQSFKLLHYKTLGYEYYIGRVRQLRERRSEVNRRNGWGVQYDYDDAFHHDWFDELEREGVELI